MQEVRTINEYLIKLNKYLEGLPENEKKQHLAELKDHMQSLKDEDISRDEQSIVSEFVKPKEMANEILNDRDEVGIDNSDINFKLATASIVAPFGPLALPIFFGEFNGISSGLVVPFIIQLILGTIFVFKFYKVRMNKQRLVDLKHASNTLVFLIALPLGLYAYRISQDGMISNFNSFYLVILLTLMIIYFILTRKLVKNKVNSL